MTSLKLEACAIRFTLKLFLAFILLLNWALPVIAGPLEDAEAA